jgi:peptidoglycan/LPS O-acetylase OafA/YrhL
MSSAGGSQRLHGLDAVRGYALLLGVVFHASASFLATRHGVWPVMDNRPSQLLSGVFFVSHIFRMATFFLIAGFFAHMSFHRRGLAGFVKDRAQRIALPLVAGWPVIFGTLLFGAWVALGGHLPKAPPPGGSHTPGGFPLTHLWFLYVLLWLYAIVLAGRALVVRLDRAGGVQRWADRAVGFVVTNPAGLALLAIPGALALMRQPHWLMWFGVPTPDQSLIPTLPALAEFLTAFTFGWLLRRQTGLLEVWTRRWTLNLGAAVVLTGALLAMVGVAPIVEPAPDGLARLPYVVAYTLAVWTWTAGLIGLALRHLNRESRVRRYIADSSYWIYLVHLPLVMALQAAVSRLAWPWEAKFAVILGVAFPLMFATYQLFVRRTVLGVILNGKRAPARAPAAAKPSPIQPEIAR